jgi:ABC-type cobalamin/Fe3+-siderophores transport system ATPase subunit
MSIQIITKYANAIMSACGLDINQAKTVVYWAIATHAIEKLTIMAILVITGPFSSGKSTLISIIRQICFQPRPIDGEISKAVLRDKLEANTTVLIEEADKVDEQLILKRYARQTSDTIVNRGNASQGYKPGQLNIFGATVLHRRLPFKDPAVDSRSIVIKTMYNKQGNYSMQTLDGAPLSAIASQVNWSNILPLPNNRAGDTWMPLFQVAATYLDKPWIQYATGELKKAMDNLSVGQEFEASQLVVSKLVSLAITPDLKQLRPRVALQETVKALKNDGNDLNPWQVGKILRGLGFSTKLSGGISYIVIDRAQFLGIAQQLGIDDDLLKQMTP